ncbi:MAG TPA: hypothetical protein VL128_01460 [Candidatus Eisenbacteria bacterium]|nr:hypothetical protein [Candidatus Eisenbacteria bacterium]
MKMPVRLYAAFLRLLAELARPAASRSDRLSWPVFRPAQFFSVPSALILVLLLSSSADGSPQLPIRV